MTNTRIAPAFILLFLACYPAVAQTGTVSLDRFDRHQKLYLLDETGRILVSDAKQLDNPTKILASVPPVLKAVDILATKLWGDREMLFVTAYGLTEKDTRSRVIQFSGVGERQCEWMLPEISAGLDVDTDHQTLYLSGSATGTVYSLKLLKDGCYGPKQLSPVLKINSGGRLGPIVIDSRRSFAFVADTLKGSVYRVVLSQGAFTQIAQSLGQPTALAYDDVLGRLYAVDAAGRRVWLIDVNRQAVPLPIVLSRDALFREPSSLTFASGGGLLVGDRIAKALYLVDLSGRVTEHFTVPN